MKIYLAGITDQGSLLNDPYDFYRLDSFYGISKRDDLPFKRYKSFMLDSGAFTFMSNKKIKLNWDEYVERYAEFINKHDIELFFELDIDVVVGIKEVERLRDKLESLTGKRCIPVWHKSRGLAYWRKIVKDYDYVAIGGIVTKEIKISEHRYFSELIKIARNDDCKVHGLGFTNMRGLMKYKFYSVDSTSWLNGGKYGEFQKFNGRLVARTPAEKMGKRGLSEKLTAHNFKEWIKFQRYADQHL